jgi:hypothetical protein
LALEKLVTGDGRRLPPRLIAEIVREMKRFATVQEQIDEVERERDMTPTACKETRSPRSCRVKSITARFTTLARKRAIALWRFVELGLVPEGAILSPRVKPNTR